MQKSMNQDRQTNTKRILIVVPHEDDEINVAGQAILNFTRRDLECHVLFTTNGDMFGLGDKRKTEAEAAAEQLGLPKENIHILDFKDQCRGKVSNTTLMCVCYACKAVSLLLSLKRQWKGTSLMVHQPL